MLCTGLYSWGKIDNKREASVNPHLQFGCMSRGQTFLFIHFFYLYVF